LLSVLRKFRRCRLLVVGDLMLDRFIWGDVERISQEAPVPVLRVVAESFRLGGAANVMHNIRALGGEVTACGVVGSDLAGRRIVAELRRLGAATQGITVEAAFGTTQKSRVIARPRHQQIVRLDRENHGEMRKATLRRIREFVSRHAPKCDGIVVSDYGKGVIHGELLDWLSEAAREKNVLCVIDPKRENFERYRHPTLVTPNLEEAAQASGVLIRDRASLIEAGRRLLTMWQAKAVIVTRGPDGISLFRPGREVRHFPTAPREMFDVTGAGDTVVAACSLALASGAGYEEASVIANSAAALVGEEVGTVAVPLRRLQELIKDKT
jgi:D-beta-D-heptose 7-phosphate kinase/D-beta-D-heptose 1-phosphate adenosyltransferase